MTEGVDWAWGRPSVAALRDAGKRFAGRYFSHDTGGKNLTRGEAETLTAGGIWLVGVWEDTAQRALQRHAAGVDDAITAGAQARACGMPEDRPVFFAVDFDASSGQMAAIMAYLDGAATVLTRARVGVYGSYDVVHAALDGKHCDWAWQTYAWSGGRWDERAQLQQYSNDHTIGGVGLDYDRSTKTDFGQWQVGKSPAVPKAPATEEEDDMIGQLITGQGAITPISWPEGKCKAIGFFADTGLAASKPVQLRVAYQRGPGQFSVHEVTVDSSKGKTVVSFGSDAPKVDAVSVERLDAQTVAVCWDAS